MPERLRTFIYSFDRSFEMAIAATSAPLVGLLAERLGFDVRPAVSSNPKKFVVDLLD